MNARGTEHVTFAEPPVGRAVPAGSDTPEAAESAGAADPALAMSHNACQPRPFALTALLRDLQPHPELDLRTMAYHLQQSDATAGDGYGHAAINEARSALEALIVSIACTIRHGATDGTDTPLRERVQNGSTFRTHRRCLMDAGFIDADESDLLQFVYSMASARGSHYGVTDEAWTRLARRIIFAVGQYFTLRYATWKRNGRQPAPPAVSCRQPTPRSWLPSLLANLLPWRRDTPTRPSSIRTPTRRKPTDGHK